MKTSHLLTSTAGAAVALWLTVALALPAQEPPAPPPPPAEQAAPEPAPAPDAAEPSAEQADEDGALRRLDVPEPPEAAEPDVPSDSTAQPADAAPVAEVPPAEEAPEAPESDEPVRSYSNEVVRIGMNVLLPANQEAGDVVAIFGNVIADGPVRGSSVAVMGDNTTNHSAREVVAVLGDATVNGHVRGEVVAVMGNIQLGPNAIVDGEVVCVGGTIDRAPGAQLNGGVQQIGPFPGVADGVKGLRTWFRTCLMLGRPLAFNADVLWAWGVAFAFLGVYLLIALLFNKGLVTCAETLERRPGMTIVVAILAAILGPILVLLLSATGVGLLLIPLTFLIGLFGKAAFLTWLGRRITLPLGWAHSVGAVLIGGLILLLLYTIPFAGFVLMKLTSGLGFGMAVYAAIIVMRQRPGRALPPPTPPAPVASPGGAAAAAPSAAPSTSSASSPAAAGVAAPGAAGFVASSPVAAETVDAGGPTPVVPPSPAYSAAPAPQQPPSLPTAPVQYSTLPRAGFWIRLAASLLDLILIVVVLSLINLEDTWPVIYGIYCAVLWGLRATTIGGIICGLKVVRLDDRKLDWPVAIVRSLGGYLSLVVLGLGFIWVAFDPERQSWHDKIAGTTVVHVPKGVTLV